MSVLIAQAAPRAAETLDVQVLHGIDSFLATERFLCKLEQARAEWIDLSEHAAAGCAHATLPHAAAKKQQDAAGSVVLVDARDGDANAAPVAAHEVAAPCARPDPAVGSAAYNDASAAAAAAAAVGDFVVVDRDDAVEAMAFYIALYISRLPEARNMGAKELQSALRETFAVLRRSRWRLVWGWGKVLYRSAAVSFSALQLYNNPWLLRAVLSALWTSSRLLYSQMV